MPQTVRKNGTSLAIQLVDMPAAYRAGDVILGKVVRRSHIVSPRGRISIKLLGRAKTRIRVRRGQNNHVTYRARYHFFDIRQTTEKLFDGPLHIPPHGEPGEWSFAIAIPEHANSRSVAMNNVQEHTYLSLKPEDIATHPLPATFLLRSDGWGTDYEGFVEYWLEAEMLVEGEKNQSVTAVLPITLETRSTLTPVANFALKLRTYSAAVSTQRMIPGMEDADLTFKQKAQKFFGSSKVPHFHWKTNVQLPSVIQLEHPDPIPILIRAKPSPDLSSDIIRDVSQVITIESMALQLKCYSTVMCPGNWSTVPHTEEQHSEHDLGLQSVLLALKRQGPVVVPQSADGEYLNLGEHMELKLDARSVYAFGQPTRKFALAPLQPSFKTYNIRRSYKLKWNIGLAVAGETHTVRGEQEVQILGPSEEQQTAKNRAEGKQPAMVTQEEVPQYETVAGPSEPLPTYQEAAGSSATPNPTNQLEQPQEPGKGKVMEQEATEA
ncbi:hypothetical protein GQ53DRAFT_837890 [Thozetella sp. PMI_491]|nr:hypothetical protein GQ53DRAFT_837890 [Thozetella sp. PMI_491]